jgi:hypothetical protein
MHVVDWTSPAGKRRLLTVLDDAEAAHYGWATALALPRRPPGRWSFGVDRPDGGLTPARRRAERARWRTTLRDAVRVADAAVASDVFDCYPSIAPRAIRLASACSDGDPEPLLAFLAAAHDAGGRGLPIGPSPSAALADAVLAIADAEAAAAGVAPIRWVDDVVFAGGRGAVSRAERAWRRTLSDLGLRDHEGKRRTLEPGRTVVGASLLGRPAHVIMRSS